MTTTTILQALRAARIMLAGERLGFASSNALPDGTFAPHDAAMMREYDKVLGMLRDATEAAQSEPVPISRSPLTDDKAVPKDAEPREQGRARLTADVVEQRLLTWRQRFVNRSGDQLALDDFMDQRSIDDLVDFVCAEDTPPPGVLDALRRLVAAIIDDDGGDDGGNAPGHAHKVPGAWDDGNHPSIAGLPCELCAAWRNARAVLSAHDGEGRDD